MNARPPGKRDARMVICEDHRTPGPPGGVRYAQNRDGVIVGMNHCCPCGCGAWGFMGLPGYDFQGHTWKVVSGTVGGTDLTLDPSIGFAKDRTTGQFHWHGYLRAGVFEEC